MGGGVEGCAPLGAEGDLGAVAAALKRRGDKLQKGLGAVEKKLANEGFLEGADPDVVAAERTRSQEMQLELEQLERNLAGLG